jgi:hypothetical protein
MKSSQLANSLIYKLVPHSKERTSNLRALQYDSVISLEITKKARVFGVTDPVDPKVRDAINKELASILTAVLVLQVSLKKGIQQQYKDSKFKIWPTLVFAISTKKEIDADKNLAALKTLKEDNALYGITRATADLTLDVGRLVKAGGKKLSAKQIIGAFNMDLFSAHLTNPKSEFSLIFRSGGGGSIAMLRASLDLVFSTLLESLEEEKANV